MKRILIISLFSLLLTVTFGKVSRVEITSRQLVLNGQNFGVYGQYEYLKGTIFFETDPSNPFNSRITDIMLSALNGSGNVESSANFEVLQPADPAKRRGIALVEVSNRGGKFSLRYFNRSTSSVIMCDEASAFGDGLLMRQGLTVIWVGWQFDVPVGENILRLNLPDRIDVEGVNTEGLVRSDWTVDEATDYLTLGHKSQLGYPATNFDDIRNVLTVRDGRDTPRTIIDRKKWSFSKETDGMPVADRYSIHSSEGFKAGKIYELVYISDSPFTVGLGLSAIRDIISYAKYDPASPFPVTKGFAAGVSQTGRFLRHFLYQGFNTDETGKQAFDGMMIITAGAGRGSFNHRFAQPSRDAHDYSAFFYPTDIFPFASRLHKDPLIWKTDGLLAHMWQESHIPKIMHINTGYEYWGRAASLIHTDALSSEDAILHDKERVYHLASGQHFVGAEPSMRNLMPSGPGYRTNPLDYSVNYRSLLVKLTEWVDTGSEPPRSLYPLISSGTLVAPEDVKYPFIEGLKINRSPHVAYRVDYGPGWVNGVIDFEPPLLTTPYKTLVSQVDNLGNETGGVRNIEIAVPLATYLPWNLREGYAGGIDEQIDFTGTFIPLQLGSGMKKAGDTRPCINDLYKNKTDYLKRVSVESEKLVLQGFMLMEDISYSRIKAEKRWSAWAEKQNNR